MRKFHNQLKPKRKNNTTCPTEYQEQCAVAKYMHTFYPGMLWFATGNGIRVGIGLAVKFKRQGCNKGAPDLIFLEPIEGYHGLCIEMKREKGGSVSPEQKAWLASLNSSGYRAVICKGFEAAKSVIDDYFGGRHGKTKP